MVRSCCVKSCREEWSPVSSLSFFSVPMKNEVLLNKWKEAIPDTKITKYSTICSKHFTSGDIQRLAVKTMLKKNVVPTIFNNRPSQQKGWGCNPLRGIPDHTYAAIDLSQETDDGQKPSASIEIARNIVVEIPERNAQIEPVACAPEKKDVAVQTSARRLGPSDREVELQKKIKILQAKLRRRDKRINGAVKP